MEHLVITIGRQCGSGGHTIGKLLAQRLGLAFYDKKIVEMVAAKTKLSPDFIRTHGEYFHGGSIGHIIGYGTRFNGSDKTGSALTDQLHQAQSEIVLEVARQGPCVIVGRCADYILRERADVLNVFIHAPIPHRADRVVRLYGESDLAPEKRLEEKDKRRRAYYKHYADREWGMSQNYHLSLDASLVGIERCAQMILDVARDPGQGQ